jgi:hypothetical protein
MTFFGSFSQRNESFRTWADDNAALPIEGGVLPTFGNNDFQALASGYHKSASAAAAMDKDVRSRLPLGAIDFGRPPQRDPSSRNLVMPVKRKLAFLLTDVFIQVDRTKL